MKKILIILSFFQALSLYSQEIRPAAPKFFIDCRWGCDQQYLKTEFTYLNFMRDRADADIFVQQIGLQNGGGGTQITLFFYGQNQFEGQNDTLVFNLPPAISVNDIRETLKKQLERGLLPYLLQTSLAEDISFTVTGRNTFANSAQPEIDPWDFWTLSLRGNFFLNGREISRNLYGKGELQANRITEREKTQFILGGDYQYSRNSLGDTARQIIENGAFYLHASEILAINDHWSYGFWGGARRYQNSDLKFGLYLNAGLEYNVFAYREVTRRQLTFRYQVGPTINRFFEETNFVNFENNHWEQTLAAAYQQIFEWGRVNLSVQQDNYLNDFRLGQTNVDLGMELNLFKGFYLNLDARYSLLWNQQPQSGYGYFLQVGASYTIGSIYSNVVNPRFWGG